MKVKLTIGIRIRSTGEWFEQEEKPTNVFLNTEEHFCGILFGNKELTISRLLKLYTNSKNILSRQKEKNQNVK